MNAYRTIKTAALAALLVCVGLTASVSFAGEAGKEKTPPPAAQAEKAARTSPGDPVAKVGNAVITRADLDRAVKVLTSQNRVAPADTPDAKKQTEEVALEQLIAAELLFQEGVKSAPKDLEKQVDFKIAQGKGKFSTPEEYEAALKGAELTEKELAEITRKDLVISSFVEKEISSKISVSDDEVKKFYSENGDKFQKEAQVKASHILCGVDAKASDEEKKKAREKAEGLLKELKAGKDFAELAKANSTCPSSAQGGDLGYFGKGQMVPAFEQAAFALKPGEVSGVVETQFGYHIIKVTDKQDAETVKLDEVKEKIGSYLKDQKTRKAVIDLITQLKGKAKIEKSL